jgi:hypothetical protein
MNLADKQDFLLKSRFAFGPELKALLGQVCKKSRMEKITSGFCGTGTFLDEEDLTVQYKVKPGGAHLIMANAKTMVCQAVETVLYEDRSYTRTWQAEQT